MFNTLKEDLESMDIIFESDIFEDSDDTLAAIEATLYPEEELTYNLVTGLELAFESVELSDEEIDEGEEELEDAEAVIESIENEEIDEGEEELEDAEAADTATLESLMGDIRKLSVELDTIVSSIVTEGLDSSTDVENDEDIEIEDVEEADDTENIVDAMMESVVGNIADDILEDDTICELY